MALLVDDIRAAVRGFVRRPLLAVIAVVMLALGLGFNTALFAVVDAVLLRSLPYPDSDRLVLLCYQYDPMTGKYGVIALNAIRAGGVLTVGALGAFIFVMLRRERQRAAAPGPLAGRPERNA